MTQRQPAAQAATKLFRGHNLRLSLGLAMLIPLFGGAMLNSATVALPF
jgi:hypothetical protein